METAFTSGTRTPFTGLSILLLILFSASACIGQGGNSYKHFIFNNPSIKWAAEYESLVNLSPKTNTISLKKWYLDRLRKQAVKTYAINNENVVINDRPVNMPWLNTQEWLTGHYILPHENILNWEFVSRTGVNGLPYYTGDIIRQLLRMR